MVKSDGDGGGGGGRDGGGEGEGGVVIRDGRVHVLSWELVAARGGDCGGGVGVAVHPLWERRAAASLARTVPAKPSWLSGGVGGGDGSEGGALEVGFLSGPAAFYVNVYTRRFQREVPPASLGCRGGILADEMGMGKVRWGAGGGRGLGFAVGGDVWKLF